MNRLKFLAFVVFVACSLSSFSQKMSVASFEAADKDLTANTAPTMRNDLNGEKSALIKIQTTERQFMFDVGSLGIVYMEEQNASHPGEIWLYVPQGVKSITIQHPIFGVINDYDLGRRLKKGKTYILKLTSDQVNTLVVDYENNQYLQVTVTPHDASLYINGIKQQLTPQGVCEIPLPFGTHTYRVTAPDYHPCESKITIDNKDSKQFLNVDLKQAFGYLTILSKPEFNGAMVLIDDVKAGELPMSRFPVKSGNHSLSVYKPLYSPYKESITVADSAFVSVTPMFQPNYAEVELTVANDRDAQIFVDGVLLGSGSWKGRIEAGNHSVDVRKMSHRSAARSITVKKDERITVPLEAPVPIYGVLQVETSPAGADVYIDGKKAGVTPYINETILVGEHSVKVDKKGHRPEDTKVNITENDPKRLNYMLTDVCTATIYPTPSYARVSINDGQSRSGEYKLDVEAGSYKVRVSAYGYTPYSKTMRLDGTTDDIHITLHRDYVRNNEIYINAGYNLLGCSGFTAGIGGYISKFNIEGTFILGLSKSETIYWNDRNGENRPYGATYKPMGGSVKVGYGFRIGNRIRITPQVGCQFIGLSESIENLFDTYSESVLDKPSAVSATFGARFSVAIAPCLGISVSPLYNVAVSKSAGYKALSDLSSKIKGYADGFGCNVSLNLFF